MKYCPNCACDLSPLKVNQRDPPVQREVQEEPSPEVVKTVFKRVPSATQAEHLKKAREARKKE